QMKATGEVMAIGQSFEEAMLKAVRGAELKTSSLDLPAFAREDDAKIVTITGCGDDCASVILKDKDVEPLKNISADAVVKMPKFPFDKFVYAARKLGTQMKATGEVMAIGQNFEEAILKAVRGAELKTDSLDLPAFARESDDKIITRVNQCTDQRIFAIYQAIKRSLMSVEEIHEITKIDNWFLYKLKNIAEAEKQAASSNSCGTLLYPPNSFKMVDTCAGEFNAETPYFYSISALPDGTNAENEADFYLKEIHNQ
ncbi:MAG: hypothetical protein J6W46_03080, partial [Spirochaetaceae bacterium]|nr:hypothetical protein [Spirochaetaceae bacterium]